MAHSRPLSPHLQIYRWRINMLQSTLHRLTGLYLSAGALLVLWGIVAAATSAPAWDVFAGFCASWPGLVLLFLWSLALLFHLCNGLQHLVHDAAHNFGPPTRDRRFNPVYWATGWYVVAASLLLTVALWAWLLTRLGGGTP